MRLTTRRTDTSHAITALLLALMALIAVACSSGATDTIEAAAPVEADDVVAAPTDVPETPAEAEPDPTAEPEPTAEPDPTAVPESTEAPEPKPEPAAELIIADGLLPLPPQPAGVAFPTEAWPEGTLRDDLEADALADLIAGAYERDEFGTIDAALVIDGGELVFESYRTDYDPKAPHVSWSVGKSVAHALLGILTGTGDIDMAAPAAIGEWQDEGDPRANITPDMLARMSSGLEWTEEADAVELFLGSNSGPAAGFQVDRDLVEPPDTVFNYSTGSTAVNGRLMADIIGTGDVFESWAHEVLFDPLGIESVVMEFDAEDNWIAGYGANMTARDFARFGLLYLRDGVWDGQRILPEGWVDYARTPSVTTGEYGSGFWIDFYSEGGFSAEGFLGQKVIIVPDHDVVVVVLADNQDSQLTGDFARQLTGLVTGS